MVSPTEKEQQEMFNTYYKEELLKQLQLPDFRKKILDRNAVKNTIDNFIFNTTLNNLQRSQRRKRVGDVRKYGVSKNGFKWFKDNIIIEAQKLEGRKRWSINDKLWIKNNLNVPTKKMIEKFPERTKNAVYIMKWRIKKGLVRGI